MRVEGREEQGPSDGERVGGERGRGREEGEGEKADKSFNSIKPHNLVT
jgi:hypothetical protein